MKLYADSSALLKNKSQINALFMHDGSMTLHVFLKRNTHFRRAYGIARKEFKLKPAFTVRARHLSGRKIRYYNNGRLFLEIVADRKLTRRQKALIKKAKRTLIVHDGTSAGENGAFLSACGNVVFSGANGNMASAIAFDFGKYNRTGYTCRYSSCLGKTLYLNGEGDLYFCPYHPEGSYLDNIGNVETLKKVFEKGNFEAVLDKAIEKRKKCSEECALFAKCGGGCPLEDVDCEELRNAVKRAGDERKAILEEKRDLADLERYKKESLMKEVSKYIF